MSLLTVCQDASGELGLDSRPIAVIGNMAVDVQRLLRFANRVGADIATRAPWQALRLKHEFAATADEVQVGAIPAAFQRFSPETVWDLSNNTVLTGPVSPVEYQARKVALALAEYTGGPRWFTRRGNDFLVTPTPEGGETYVYEYQSGAFCQSAAGVPQNQWLADTDTGRISEELITLGVIARFLSADGQPAQQAMMDYEKRLALEIKNDAPTGGILPAGDIFGTGRFSTGEPTGRTNTREDVWGGGGAGVWG